MLNIGEGRQATGIAMVSRSKQARCPSVPSGKRNNFKG